MIDVVPGTAAEDWLETYASMLRIVQHALLSDTPSSNAYDAGHSLPEISSASFLISFFLYDFDLPSIADLADRTSKRPCSDDSHAGDRYSTRPSAASNLCATMYQLMDV